jgi:uncharacterized membrane protein
MGLSSLRLRPRLAAMLGERAFLGLYSLVALGLFVPLVWVYLGNRQAGPLLWTTPVGPVLLWLLYAVMGVGWVLVVVGLIQPSPVVAGGPAEARVRGAHRLTRHPPFMGFAIFGALHLLLLLGVHASDAVFFAGFPLFSLLGAWHQDRRKLRTAGETFRAWHAATPFLPFTGRETARGLRELPPLGVALGVVLTIALRLLHGPLFS